MYIYVSPDFRFKTDQYGHTLECRSDGKVKNTGEHKDSWALSYHPTYTQVAKKIIETSLNGVVDSGDIQELKDIQKKLEELAESLGNQIYIKVVEDNG